MNLPAESTFSFESQVMVLSSTLNKFFLAKTKYLCLHTEVTPSKSTSRQEITQVEKAAAISARMTQFITTYFLQFFVVSGRYLRQILANLNNCN